jgi:hypothetical protein
MRSAATLELTPFVDDALRFSEPHARGKATEKNLALIRLDQLEHVHRGAQQNRAVPSSSTKVLMRIETPLGRINA